MEAVDPYRIERVTCEIVSKISSRAVVKRATPRYVSSVVVNKVEVVESVQTQKVIESVMNVSHVILKFPAPSFVSHMVVKETQTMQSVSKVVNRRYATEFVDATINQIKPVTKTDNDSPPILTNSSKFSNKLFSICQNYTQSLQKIELKYRFIVIGFYYKLLMRCFWVYFMFTDFLKVNTILAKPRNIDCITFQTMVFLTFLNIICCMFCLVKIKIS